MSTSNVSSSAANVFSSFTTAVKSAAKMGANVAEKGLSTTRDTIHSAADKLGLRDKVMQSRYS